MIAAITDLRGKITGAHRTWLALDGSGKAAIGTPRRAMGNLLGHAVRFGTADDLLAVGEGIETVLSLRATLPDMPMAAALSAGHLAALELPPTLRKINSRSKKKPKLRPKSRKNPILHKTACCFPSCATAWWLWRTVLFARWSPVSLSTSTL